MICFRAKKDQELKKKDIWVPLLIKKKHKNLTFGFRQRDGQGALKFLFFILFLPLLLFSIYGNRTVRIRRGKKQSALLNKGYAWEPKTRDFAEFLIKI